MPVPSGTPLSGTDGRVNVNGVSLNVDTFTFTANATDVDSTSFEDGGYETGIMTTKAADIEISGYYDASLPPFNAGQGPLAPGSIIGPCLLYVSRTLNKFVNAPLIRVISAPITNKVKDKVTVSFKAKTQGPYFLPT